MRQLKYTALIILLIVPVTLAEMNRAWWIEWKKWRYRHVAY